MRSHHFSIRSVAGRFGGAGARIAGRGRKGRSRDKKTRRGRLSPPRRDLKIGRGLFLVVPIGVSGGEAVPLLRQILEGEDRGDRADRNASPAVDAFGRVDIE